MELAIIPHSPTKPQYFNIFLLRHLFVKEDDKVNSFILICTKGK